MVQESLAQLTGRQGFGGVRLGIVCVPLAKLRRFEEDHQRNVPREKEFGERSSSLKRWALFRYY